VVYQRPELKVAITLPLEDRKAAGRRVVTYNGARSKLTLVAQKPILPLMVTMRPQRSAADQLARSCRPLGQHQPSMRPQRSAADNLEGVRSAVDSLTAFNEAGQQRKRTVPP